jgi:hypothetical protein
MFGNIAAAPTSTRCESLTSKRSSFESFPKKTGRAPPNLFDDALEKHGGGRGIGCDVGKRVRRKNVEVHIRRGGTMSRARVHVRAACREELTSKTRDS